MLFRLALRIFCVNRAAWSPGLLDDGQANPSDRSFWLTGHRPTDMAKFQVEETPLAGLLIVHPKVIEDDRGFFMESYTQADLVPFGIGQTFIQDNHSLSREPGTLRGLHFQTPPFAQDKLVRVVRGRIWDVAVDIRRASATFGQWFGLELDAVNKTQLFVPVGFAHGFVTLEPETEVIYKVSAAYSAANDAGMRWDDPDLAIAWPDLATGPVLSAKDQGLPSLAKATLFP